MINKSIYNLSFRVFMDKKHEGVVDLESNDGRDEDRFGRFLMDACI